LLDAACVERLVASERQQQLGHAMGEGTKQSAMTDHRRRVGHEAIVVSEGNDLDAVGDPDGVAIDRRAEREDRVEVESCNCLADAVDQRRLTLPHGRAERQQHPRPLGVRTSGPLRRERDIQRPGTKHVRWSVAVDVKPARRGDQHQLGGFPRAEAVAGGSEPQCPMSRREAAKVRRPAASGSQHLHLRESVQEVHERHGWRARRPSRRERSWQHAIDDRDVGAQLVEHVSGVEGDLRTGHGRHE
jgi:hypothetical protein